MASSNTSADVAAKWTFIATAIGIALFVGAVVAFVL